VGNPTILATFTVIAAILPMAFVSGMMGPYMSPMPIGASIAMIYPCSSLTVTLFGYHLLQEKDDQKHKRCRRLKKQVYKIYNRLERPLLESSMKRRVLVGDSFVDRLLQCFSPNLF
jgi:multidrug efflux pump subunit AcrB